MPAWARVTICRTGGGEAGSGDPGDEEVPAELSDEERTAELESVMRALVVEVHGLHDGGSAAQVEVDELMRGIDPRAEGGTG